MLSHIGSKPVDMPEDDPQTPHTAQSVVPYSIVWLRSSLNVPVFTRCPGLYSIAPALEGYVAYLRSDRLTI